MECRAFGKNGRKINKKKKTSQEKILLKGKKNGYSNFW